MESNYKKSVSKQKFLVKLKFCMCVIDHRPSCYINFDVYRTHSFFTGYTKCHTIRHFGTIIKEQFKAIS